MGFGHGLWDAGNRFRRPSNARGPSGIRGYKNALKWVIFHGAGADLDSTCLVKSELRAEVPSPRKKACKFHNCQH